jgi:hypothetical protein
MEILAIPLVALGALYVVSNQKKGSNKNNTVDPFTTGHDYLPNTNIPDRNFQLESDPEIGTIADMDYTSKLSTVNRYDGPDVYTDKYFNPMRNSFTANEVSHGERMFDSLTGDKVDASYFKHANMVPFFGSNIRTPLQDANTVEPLLDSLVGAGSQFQTKTEQSPLFSPSENLQWGYGAPNNTDFIRSRMVVSNKMNNVRPFEEERVTPGLNGESSMGYNSGMMARETWMPKTVDELRIANNPKHSHMILGHEGPAMSRITNVGLLGHQEKNRPERAYEYGPERYMTTTGLEKGQMLHSIPVERHVNRTTTTTSYVGGAGTSNPETYVEGEYMPSKHIDLGPVPLQPANAVGRSGAREGEFGIHGKMAYPNNRTITRTDDYFGAVGGAFGSVVAPLLDMLRPSRKENTIGSLRPYQNPSSRVQNSYLFNPADRPAPTLREMTEQSLEHYNISAGQRGGAYAVTEHQPAFTTRQQTGDYYYSGVAGGGEGHKQVRPYDAEYAQRNNDIKSSTIAGRMVPGNMSLMQGDINMSSKPKDIFMQNTRPIAPTNMPYQSPDVSGMGKVSGMTPLYQGIQTDRNAPDILDALKTNPYTLSVVNGL